MAAKAFGSGFGDYTNQNKSAGAFFKPTRHSNGCHQPRERGHTCAGPVCNKTATIARWQHLCDNSIDVVNNDSYGTITVCSKLVKRSNQPTSMPTTPGRRPWEPDNRSIPSSFAATTASCPSIVRSSQPLRLLLLSAYTGDNKIVSGFANGWTISNYTTWQGVATCRRSTIQTSDSMCSTAPSTERPSRPQPLPTNVGNG